MASFSSSSPPSSSSSLNSRWKYDVFISYRREDTRYNFTSHLYAALHWKEIKTFNDDEELERGDEISQLLNAIEESKISIIIFSKYYGSSKWCLDELVKILECHNMNGQIVIPVFYGVNPSDVRKQTGSFGEAFSRHEQNFKKMPGMVQKWRDALTEATNISGFESLKIRSDLELIDQIVNDIWMKLQNIQILRDFKSLVGLDSRIEDIKSLLRIGSSDFRIVGICGMSGIGKTTIAEALYSQISKEFEGRCIMINVKEKSEKGVGLVQLQKHVLSELLEKNIEVGDPNISHYAKKRLQRMKVFIVVDDVSKCEELEYLARGLVGFGPGSRIIITTRDKKVLEKFRVDYIYQVEALNYHECLELFYNYAFRQNHRPQDLMALSSRIVDYAKGNPLTLKVLGSSLHGKSELDWESALHKLRQIPESSINDVLKFCYDELSLQEKRLFLDIACFFKGNDKDYVTKIMGDPGFVNYKLNALVDKSLITILDNKLEMHELLQEMGKEIVRGESVEGSGKHKMLWPYEDLKDNKEDFQLKSIDLHHPQHFAIVPAPIETTNLKRVNHSRQKLPYIPSNIENFKNLRKLYLRECESRRCFPRNIHFKYPMTNGFYDNVNLRKPLQISYNDLVEQPLIPLSDNNMQMCNLFQAVDREIVRRHGRLWHLVDVYHVLKKNKGCKLLRKYKKPALAVFFFVLEAVSVVLDQLGNGKLGLLLAAFILSAFGFATSIYAFCVEEGHQRTTSRARIQAERQLGVLEVLFSAIQLIVSYFHFILAILDVKNSYNVSVFPLAFALVGLYFAFRKNDDHSAGYIVASEPTIFKDLEQTLIHCGISR